MSMCLACINLLCSENEKITEEEVLTEYACCDKCGKTVRV